MSGTVKHVIRYLNDTKLIQRASTLLNFLFCGAYLISAAQLHSLWFAAISVYSLSLGAIRFFLLRSGDVSDRRKELLCCRRCGWLMFWLQIAMTGIVVQSILQNRHAEYPGHLIYLSALFAFSRLVLALVGLIRSPQMASPLAAAAHTLGLAAALMAVFILQLALISAFGTTTPILYGLNCMTGGGICAAVLGLAISLVVRAGGGLKELDAPSHKIEKA